MKELLEWTLQQREMCGKLSDEADNIRDSLYYLDKYNTFSEIILKIQSMEIK